MLQYRGPGYQILDMPVPPVLGSIYAQHIIERVENHIGALIGQPHRSIAEISVGTNVNPKCNITDHKNRIFNTRLKDLLIRMCLAIRTHQLP